MQFLVATQNLRKGELTDDGSRTGLRSGHWYGEHHISGDARQNCTVCLNGNMARLSHGFSLVLQLEIVIFMGDSLAAGSGWSWVRDCERAPAIARLRQTSPELRDPRGNMALRWVN